MSEHIEYQTIEHNGHPAFVLVPYKDFERIRPLLNNEFVRTGIPHSIVEANILHGVPMIKAWREYLNLTQQQLAEKAGMTQPALTKLERQDANPRKATLKKLATALGITVEQLEE